MSDTKAMTNAEFHIKLWEAHYVASFSAVHPEAPPIVLSYFKTEARKAAEESYNKWRSGPQEARLHEKLQKFAFSGLHILHGLFTIYLLSAYILH